MSIYVDTPDACDVSAIWESQRSGGFLGISHGTAFTTPKIPDSSQKVKHASFVIFISKEAATTPIIEEIEDYMKTLYEGRYNRYNTLWDTVDYVMK